jgi:hypothetical protein
LLNADALNLTIFVNPRNGFRTHDHVVRTHDHVVCIHDHVVGQKHRMGDVKNISDDVFYVPSYVKSPPKKGKWTHRVKQWFL